jgi:PAS domain-containing protein
MIIGITGFIGSGKDTVANYLVAKHGFVRDSFAGTLKDAVARVFGWDRELLEGLTHEARVWREQVDPWWAKRLNMPHLTPRHMLQLWGTEVCRQGFHNEIWIASLENRLRKTNENIVISDVRFPNELAAIRNFGGICIWVKRGELPEWYNCALTENTTHENEQWLLEDAGQLMPQQYPGVHHSEWAWIGQTFDREMNNNGTVEDLYEQVNYLLSANSHAKLY